MRYEKSHLFLLNNVNLEWIVGICDAPRFHLDYTLFRLREKRWNVVWDTFCNANVHQLLAQGLNLWSPSHGNRPKCHILLACTCACACVMMKVGQLWKWDKICMLAWKEQGTVYPNHDENSQGEVDYYSGTSI